MSEVTRRTVEQFATRARDHGAEVTRVSTSEATEAIDERVTRPAVGTAPPFEDVQLPPGVETDPTPADLDAATTGVTAAPLAVADYGSLLLESTPDGAEPISLFPDRHVAVLQASDVVPDIAASLSYLADQDEPTSGVLATGPSATADMGDLVLGAHGPSEVEVVVIE